MTDLWTRLEANDDAPSLAGYRTLADDAILALERILDTWPAPSNAEYEWLHMMVTGERRCDGADDCPALR